MNTSIIQEKSYLFAIRIIKLYQHLSDSKKEFVISKQLLRSGTSIWANVEEWLWGASKKDFYAKLSISYKEARETGYWLRLLRDTWFLHEHEFNSIFQDCEELIKILGSIKKSSSTTLNS